MCSLERLNFYIIALENSVWDTKEPVFQLTKILAMKGTLAFHAFCGLTFKSDYQICHFLLDTRKGLCFAVIRNDVCQAVTKKMMQVKKKECCCTAGKAWGTRCELCPSRGTGNKDWNLILFCFPLHILKSLWSFAYSVIFSIIFANSWVQSVVSNSGPG